MTPSILAGADTELVDDTHQATAGQHQAARDIQTADTVDALNELIAKADTRTPYGLARRTALMDELRARAIASVPDAGPVTIDGEPAPLTPACAHRIAYGYALGVLDATPAGTSNGVDSRAEVDQFARAYRHHARRNPDTLPSVRAAFAEWRYTGHIVCPDYTTPATAEDSQR